MERHPEISREGEPWSNVYAGSLTLAASQERNWIEGEAVGAETSTEVRGGKR